MLMSVKHPQTSKISNITQKHHGRKLKRITFSNMKFSPESNPPSLCDRKPIQKEKPLPEDTSTPYKILATSDSLGLWEGQSVLPLADLHISSCKELMTISI